MWKHTPFGSVLVVGRGVVHGVAQLRKDVELVLAEPDAVVVVACQRRGHGEAC